MTIVLQIPACTNFCKPILYSCAAIILLGTSLSLSQDSAQVQLPPGYTEKDSIRVEQVPVPEQGQQQSDQKQPSEPAQEPQNTQQASTDSVQDTTQQDTAKSVSAWSFTLIPYKSTDSTKGNIISIIANPNERYENIIVIEIGENIYLQSQSRFVRYDVGGAGFLIGFLVPIRIPYVLTYYHAKATFHRAVVMKEDVVDTYITATNELRFGKSLLIKNIPFEYTPVFGVGYNNGIVIYRDYNGKLRGGETHYFFNYTIGLCIRQPFLIEKRYYTLGLSATYERAFTPDEDTKQRLVFSLLFGL
jgi:hypothetical protein